MVMVMVITGVYVYRSDQHAIQEVDDNTWGL